MRAYMFIMILPLLLTLSSCGPDRATKDAKLETACLAAIQSLYGENDVIEVQDSFFSSEKSSEDTNLRTVNLTTHYVHNHGITEEKKYSCSFEEPSFSFSYAPRFYNLDRAGMKIGNFDGTIEGNFEDMSNINKIVDDALGLSH